MTALACSGLSWPSALALSAVVVSMFGCLAIIIWKAMP